MSAGDEFGPLHQETPAPGARLTMQTREALTDAARLLAFGLQPRKRTATDLTYRELVQRAETDPGFYDLLRTLAMGQGLMISEVNARAGLVLAAEEDSPYRMSIGEYSTRAMAAGKSHERVLHGIAWLATAAMSFPRPADLADDSYVGRVTVEGVDAFVREACRRLDEQALAQDEDLDVPSADPGLERAWRTYQRRHAAGKTGDARRHVSSTQGIISKAMNVMVEQGFLNNSSDERKGTFTTTPRFQVHVRELASQRAYRELIEMGILVVADGTGSLAPARNPASTPGTAQTRGSAARPDGQEDLPLDL